MKDGMKIIIIGLAIILLIATITVPVSALDRELNPVSVEQKIEKEREPAPEIQSTPVETVEPAQPDQTALTPDSVIEKPETKTKLDPYGNCTENETGDANGDGFIDISDAVFIVNYIFSGDPAPKPLCRGDVNLDGIVDISDVVALIEILFGDTPASTYIAGDADGDGIVNICDVTFIINYLFSDGPEPNPLAAGDANGDGSIDMNDVGYLINYIFNGGPPAPVKGLSPTPKVIQYTASVVSDKTI